jgi:hypothetical protein
MVKPSYFANIISGLFILIALYYLYIEIYINQSDIKGIQLINLLLFISTAVSLHGLLHIQAEINYKFNPLEGKLTY